MTEMGPQRTLRSTVFFTYSYTNSYTRFCAEMVILYPITTARGGLEDTAVEAPRLQRADNRDRLLEELRNARRTRKGFGDGTAEGAESAEKNGTGGGISDGLSGRDRRPGDPRGRRKKGADRRFNGNFPAYNAGTTGRGNAE
jgi:hypothetical protein